MTLAVAKRVRKDRSSPALSSTRAARKLASQQSAPTHRWLRTSLCRPRGALRRPSFRTFRDVDEITALAPMLPGEGAGGIVLFNEAAGAEPSSDVSERSPTAAEAQLCAEVRQIARDGDVVLVGLEGGVPAKGRVGQWGWVLYA